MNGQETATLIAALLAFGASTISATVLLYSSRFSRFAHERWWERKADAYNRIVEALSEMVEYYRITYLVEVEGSRISARRKKVIATRWRRGWEEVRKATNIGAFLISEEASLALHGLWQHAETYAHPDDWFARIENDFVSAQQCLATLVVSAKKDLKISSA